MSLRKIALLRVGSKEDGDDSESDKDGNKHLLFTILKCQSTSWLI